MINRRGFVAGLLGMVGLGGASKAGQTVAWNGTVWGPTEEPMTVLHGRWLGPAHDQQWVLTNTTPHTYDWHEGRSDDPRFAETSLPYGLANNRIFLDGQDVTVLPTRKLKTGRDGWIEFLPYDKDGQHPLCVENENLLSLTLRGTVEYYGKVDGRWG